MPNREQRMPEGEIAKIDPSIPELDESLLVEADKTKIDDTVAEPVVAQTVTEPQKAESTKKRGFKRMDTYATLKAKTDKETAKAVDTDVEESVAVQADAKTAKNANVEGLPTLEALKNKANKEAAEANIVTAQERANHLSHMLSVVEEVRSIRSAQEEIGNYVAASDEGRVELKALKSDLEELLSQETGDAEMDPKNAADYATLATLDTAESAEAYITELKNKIDATQQEVLFAEKSLEVTKPLTAADIELNDRLALDAIENEIDNIPVMTAEEIDMVSIDDAIADSKTAEGHAELSKELLNFMDKEDSTEGFTELSLEDLGQELKKADVDIDVDATETLKVDNRVTTNQTERAFMDTDLTQVQLDKDIDKLVEAAGGEESVSTTEILFHRLRGLKSEIQQIKVPAMRDSASKRWWQRSAYTLKPKFDSRSVSQTFGSTKGLEIQNMDALRQALKDNGETHQLELLDTYENVLGVYENDLVDATANDRTQTKYRATKGVIDAAKKRSTPSQNMPGNIKF